MDSNNKIIPFPIQTNLFSKYQKKLNYLRLEKSLGFIHLDLTSTVIPFPIKTEKEL